MQKSSEPVVLSKAHPWHGIPTWSEPGKTLTCYIEMVPSDSLKCELDKESGLLRVDRPQKFSNYFPALYGLLPRTYSAEASASYVASRIARPGLQGDGDPLDVCVLTEARLWRGDILVEARPIGGFRMIDGGEVDDKIIAVLKSDPFFGSITDLKECPKAILDRLQHYFLTYKQLPGVGPQKCEIVEIFDADEAVKTVQLGERDYQDHFAPKTH